MWNKYIIKAKAWADIYSFSRQFREKFRARPHQMKFSSTSIFLVIDSIFWSLEAVYKYFLKPLII